MGGEKKRNGTTPGPGRRVFKLKTSKSIRGKLKDFYDMLTSLLKQVELLKSAFRYREEWENSFVEVVHNRLKSGKWLRPKKKKRKNGKRKKKEKQETYPEETTVLAYGALYSDH